MPAYVVKVTDEHGWISAPVVANCGDEAEAVKLVRLLVGEVVKVECKGIRPDVMKAAFGNVQEGTAVFREDWTWSKDGKTPRL